MQKRAWVHAALRSTLLHLRVPCPTAAGIAALGLMAPALAQGAECTAAALDQAHADAMKAFEAMDAQGIAAAKAQVVAVLGCLEEPVSPQTAASVHRIEGITAFLGRDLEASARAFHAAASADPAFTFPERLVPVGHPMHKIYTEGSARLEGPIEALVTPQGYALRVDGAEAVTRPADRPALLQVTRGDRAAWSGYLAYGAPLPAWDLPAPPGSAEPTADAPTEVVPGEAPRGSRSRATVPLAVAGAGAWIASGASYGVAAGQRSRFDDPATPLDDLTRLRRSTNTWMSTSVATGALGLGLGLTSALTAVRF